MAIVLVLQAAYRTMFMDMYIDLTLYTRNFGDVDRGDEKLEIFIIKTK